MINPLGTCLTYARYGAIRALSLVGPSAEVELRADLAQDLRLTENDRLPPSS